MDLRKSCHVQKFDGKDTKHRTLITAANSKSNSKANSVEPEQLIIEEELSSNDDDNVRQLTPQEKVQDTKLIPSDNYHKYCYRHNPDVQTNKASDFNKMNEIQLNLERIPSKDQNMINSIWSNFGSANSFQRNLILQGLLTQCCFPQLSFISQEISSLIRIDFISTLPVEISSKILCYLDCASLCNAAQVSKKWQKLADDDRVWHHMCEQHIDRKCPNCGWGLPLLSMKRAREFTVETNKQTKRRKLSSSSSGSSSGSFGSSSSGKPEFKTRPWKTVYSERFKVERNWRKGIFKTREFKGHKDGILCLKYDHKYLFTGSYDTTIKMWDINTGECLKTLESHQKGVKSLVFDEQKLITGSFDSTIKVWNYHSGECISTYRGHTDSVLSVDFYKKFIVSGSADRTLKIWNVENRTCYALRGHLDNVNSVKIHSKSLTVFSGSDDCTIRMWDLKTNKCLKIFKGHIAEVQKVIPLNLPEDYELSQDINEGDEEEEEEGEDELSEDASEFGTIDYNDSTREYPTYLLTASLDNTIKLWNVKTGKCIRTQFGHVEGIWDISCDNFRIVSGAHDRFTKIWDLQTGKCMNTFSGHNSPVTCVGIGDSSFASGCDTGLVRLTNFDIM
ncbi:F-box protein [Wickerhamomyces ciferrii]|uniref:F-box protein n=1 Tax=Wickerhamomyces ciferrii (strain ATCC 14091 / BCRC 22168 / CBS 111 / JCM 3599 / NBRC 0793 / NRRL Y-1031 F-60-10) TaxID=1206466 RepID=K0KK83_WICCF|nr:F-box protein [Wickerhamomyces ciferrii]CCH41874.1 F-box protein [Wickerhamomyces ciferrii]